MTSNRFRLSVLAGPDQGRVLEVSAPQDGPVKIGRAQGMDPDRDLVCEKDAKVSRSHATVELASGGYLLLDQGSTNGTRLRGQKLEPGVPVELHDGDEVRVGPDTVIRFEVPAAEQRQPAPRPTPNRRPQPRPPDQSRFMASATPRERFGPFTVYESLSRSEADTVDVAVDTRGDKLVALKRFEARLLSRAARRRIKECAENARRWDHPNIAAVFETGERNGKLYVASRLVEGEPLGELHSRFAREIDPTLAAYVAREACVALEYARGAVPGFVHRNINPRTIIISSGGEVVLVNFGFVPIKALLETTVKLTVADARYLSPEHRMGRGLEPRSDVFSVGIVLYELLAQEPIDPRRTGALPDVDTVRPEVPLELADITTRATAIRSEERFRTPGEMGAELTSALDQLAPQYGPELANWMAAHFPDAGRLR